MALSAMTVECERFIYLFIYHILSGAFTVLIGVKVGPKVNKQTFSTHSVFYPLHVTNRSYTLLVHLQICTLGFPSLFCSVCECQVNVNHVL